MYWSEVVILKKIQVQAVVAIRLPVFCAYFIIGSAILLNSPVDSIDPLNVIAQKISNNVLSIPYIPPDFSKSDLSASTTLKISFILAFTVVKLTSPIIAFITPI